MVQPMSQDEIDAILFDLPSIRYTGTEARRINAAVKTRHKMKPLRPLRRHYIEPGRLWQYRKEGRLLATAYTVYGDGPFHKIKQKRRVLRRMRWFKAGIIRHIWVP